jgi:hypothetical protein
MAMPGSYVYAMARGGGLGSLMRVSSDDDEETLVEYLQLDQTKTGRKQASAHGQTFVLERVGGGSSYEADPTELWSVDHMVRSVSKSKSGRVERVRSTTRQQTRRSARGAAAGRNRGRHSGQAVARPNQVRDERRWAV